MHPQPTLYPAKAQRALDLASSSPTPVPLTPTVLELKNFRVIYIKIHKKLGQKLENIKYKTSRVPSNLDFHTASTELYYLTGNEATLHITT